MFSGRSTYEFTDPLGSPDGAGVRRRIRLTHAVVYGAAAPSLLLALLTDGGPDSQRLATGAAMAATALMAVVLLAWRRPPDRLLLWAFPAAALTVTSIAVLDPPLALTPMYYVWPLLMSAYFLQRREILVTYGVVCASFGAASLFLLPDGPLLMQWLTVVIVGAVVVGFVVFLKERMLALVTRLRALAREDALTGALNRRALVECLDAEIEHAGRSGGSCSVAVVDIDHFKRINDCFGHAAGDAALRQLVTTVSARLQGRDALGRLGGDEFAVLLVDAGPDAVEAYADELRTLVAADASSAGSAFSVSIGVASLIGGGMSAEDLIATADEALYIAKRDGRDTIRLASRHLGTSSIRSAAA